MHTQPRNRQPPTALTRIAGGVCLCIGVAALATAHPDLHVDSAIWQPVSLLGSLGLLLSGLSLMALAHLRPAWSFVGGALLGGLGSLILFLHGIAPLLPEETLRSSWLLHLLSLSPPSALSFALGGLGLLFCGRPARRAWRPATIAALGSTTLALAMVSLLLQIVDSSGNNMVDSLARLPPLLASGLLCLGFGLMSHAAALSPLNPARRAPWLPISIGLGLATFTFAAWRALTAFDRVHLDHVLSTAAIAFRTHVVTQMRAEVDNMQRMANRWELGGGTARELWEADAASYIADRPGVLGVLWLAPPALEPRWGIPFAASAPWSRSLTTDQRVRASLTRARDECRPMLSPTFALDHGASGFIICVPLFVESRFDGLIASVVRIQEFLDSVFTDTVLQGFDVILTDGERALYGPHARNDKVDVAASVQVELSGLSWQLYVVPRPGDAATARSALPETTLVIGLLMAALVTLSVHLGQTAAFRARELEVVNNELERRVAAGASLIY
ncbi:MAG: CHASE domain-containing protein [Verrucomicrobia bacterium]|nr:CHASE domain-containing protein [Verrucomicrobiota bacterium]